MNPSPDMTKPVFHESLNERIGDPRGVHVWACDLDATGNDWMDRGDPLSTDELLQAQRLRPPEAQRRYVRSHFLTRHLLADILQKPAGDIAFSRGAFGKPFVQPFAGTGTALDFSFSHSKNAFLFAVCFGGAVGVDVEIVREDPDWMSVAELFFAPAEMASLRAAPPSGRQDLFFQYWTMKEASAKLTGRGISENTRVGKTETADNRQRLHTVFHVGRDHAAAAVVWTA